MINRFLNKIFSKITTKVLRNQEQQMFLLGQIATRLLNPDKITKLEESEFKVFSQWGDDGIIQYLINKVKIENKVFVEFGVEKYTEANTRFLLMNNNWKGLIMDGSKNNIDYIKADSIYWKYDLTAKEAFVTAENINDLLKEEGICGDIGLLHIDIDGNDYWVWKAIDVVSPRIMILEYNSVFGPNRAITVPYKSDFYRLNAHKSALYFGASLSAFCSLAKEKGYIFVGSNSAGNNAYFVKEEFADNLNHLTAQEGYIYSRFSESRDENGRLTFIRGDKRKRLIEGLKVYNVLSDKIEDF